MGKVGSSTIKNSLKHLGVPTLHIHRYYFDSFETNEGLLALLRKIKMRFLYNYYIKNKNAKVITLFRDPLSRNISSFFQNLNFYFKRNQLINLDFNMLRDKFNKLERIHKTPNDWFFSEFLKKTGIDILKHQFDKNKGYIVIKHKKVEYFICTLESLNSLECVIADFIRNKDFRLINENEGHAKWYSNLYNEFKIRYSPSKEMIEALYHCKTTNYFYDKDSINNFKAKWNKN